MRHTVAAAVAVAALIWTASTFAQTEIRVFTGGAMSEPVREVGNVFAKSSGHRLVYVTDTTGALSKRLLSGERADVIVVTSAAIQALEKDGKIAAGSRVDLARALIGVGVKAGAPSPDLSTTETLQGGAAEGEDSVVRESGVGRYVRHLLRGAASENGHRGRDEAEDGLSHAGVGGRRCGCGRRGRARHHVHQ